MHIKIPPYHRITLRQIHCLLLTGFIFLFCEKLAHGENSVIHAVQKAARSTVSVTCQVAGMIPQRPVGAIDPNTGQLVIARQARVVQYKQEGGGIILDPRGFVATNAHNIRNDMPILVNFQNGALQARVIKTFPEDDIAILKVDPPQPLEAITLGNSDQLKQGDPVYAIGNADIHKNSFAEGVVTGLGNAQENANKPAYVSVLRVSFEVYQGDSGAPIIDREGRLVGIFVARERQVGNMSYGIPVNLIRKRYAECLAELNL